MQQPDDRDASLAFGSPRLTARVRPLGAELCSLRDAAGREHLWQAGEAWPRHAPILFPVVGRLAEDVLLLDGQRFPMRQHGFARDHRFELIEREASSCRLLLTDSAATQAVFPFAFGLDVAYAVHEATLTIAFTVTNPGEAPLPFCIGGHPAFAWPLPGAASKAGHLLVFEQVEDGPLYRPGADGLLRPSPAGLPLQGRRLALSEALFADGALVLLRPAGRHLRFGAPDAPGLEVAWQGFEQLGIWMKPGCDFLCIEPWAGHADIAGQQADFRRKPGVQLLGPGESRRFLHRITLLG